jgi:diaminopimelate epimerase
MKSIAFTKYHGTGNDFIMVDNRHLQHVLNAAHVKLLCDRHFGIGADGVILIEPDHDAEFFMNYYNSDGSQSFCGNGSRCAVHFAAELGLVSHDAGFRAIDGEHHGRIVANWIEIAMRDAQFPQEIPEGYFIDTGSPHVVVYVDRLETYPVVSEGRRIRNSQPWGERGTNVNFLQKTQAGLHMRTYERGVENETLSCGTGATAAAIVDAFIHGGNERTLITQGGELKVRFTQNTADFTEIWLCGTATPVFSGNIQLP